MKDGRFRGDAEIHEIVGDDNINCDKVTDIIDIIGSSSFIKSLLSVGILHRIKFISFIYLFIKSYILISSSILYLSRRVCFISTLDYFILRIIMAYIFKL